MSGIMEAFGVFERGGSVMWGLFVIAAILYVVAVATILFLIRGNLSLKNKSQWGAWIKNPELGEGRVGEMIHYVLDVSLSAKAVVRRFHEIKQNYVGVVDRRIMVINTLVATAPLTGLLGTVMGMLAMFNSLASGGEQGMDKVSIGMYEALLTTLTGLMVALPGMFLASRIKTLRNELESVISQVESAILIEKFNQNKEDV